MLVHKDEGALHPVFEDTGKVAHEGNPGDVLQIPAKADFLKSHDDDTCCRPDDEHRTAHASAVGQKLPEDAVHRHISSWRDGVHVHTASHERHVVDNRTDHADNARHQVVVVATRVVEPLSQAR